MNSRKRQGLAFALIIGLSVGFAYLSTSLNILGSTTVARTSWDVHFENVQVNEASVYAEEPQIDENETTVSYNVHLDLPGDFYEFRVDAVNDGTIDAMIETFTSTEISSRVAQYLSYSVTYSDGGEIKQNDILKAKTSTTYKVRVEFLKDIEASDLDENGVDLELSFGVEYVHSTVVKSEFVKLVKDKALSDSSINFGAISSDSNGRGLYVMHETTEDDYPIYYYRGNVNNNNAKFAGYCWKIVRTTETGGTKLLYNGTPNQNGYCTNKTGDTTRITTSSFNSSSNSPAYVGYMYGKVYPYSSTSLSSAYLYGSNIEYKNGVYQLINTTNSSTATSINTHHYTCLNATGECSNVYYIYFIRSSTAYYITLKDGKNVDDALKEMKENKTNSTVKTIIDNWFKNTFNSYFTNNNKDYNDYLEDTIWCNDRSMNITGTNATYLNNGWNPNGGSTSNKLWYGSYGRIKFAKPSFDCPNKEDSFTVDSSKGNGALTYPLGLLTADETTFAGSRIYPVGNSSYYLYTGQYWWAMTPVDFFGDQYSRDCAHVFDIVPNGDLGDGDSVNANHGVRPAISLKPGVKIASDGDGTATSPYEFVVD